VALWWYPRARRPGVDLASFDDPYLATAERWLAERNREVWALDLTADLGISAIAAVSRRTDPRREGVMLGFGAHLDPAVAIRRAVGELGQMLPIVDGGDDASGGPPPTLDPDLERWLETATVASEPWLAPDPDSDPRQAGELPRLAGGDLAADVGVCVERLRDAGLELLVVDQSRPEVELRVVKAIVPGLRHFWRRLGPGRLYDVPPRLGWVEGPQREEELNPWGMIL
jgi:ribosomal protein S12 methylthiotransferase accessory factor